MSKMMTFSSIDMENIDQKPIMNLLILDILFDSVSQFNAIAKIKASF
jgi:hypothetical protein